jgi:hypothetical protein
MDANARGYLLALFADDAGRLNQVATPPTTQAQLDRWNEYRQFTRMDGPTLTGGPAPGRTPATVEYTAVVRAKAPSGLDYRFDFTLTLDRTTHRVVGSSSTRAVLEPRPCCR